MSSREFNREPSRVKRAAATEDVIVTERGKPTLALIRYDEYRRMKGEPRTLLELFESLPDTSDIDVEFERRREIHKPFDFD
ncbi:MAG TPA: type II toxin-antitoxin system prevent-host-death family antitoxin [Allosphingosinicella sp.]|nr:type II toxin-antitoxin system prevent-host-death family antitoxin [Allosphingosinicella sp.]